MNIELQQYIDKVSTISEAIPQHRQVVLKKLIDYIVKKEGKCGLMYVCTHNSRRSQFAQVWSFVLSKYIGFPQIRSFSAGTEETAFNERAINALLDTGLKIEQGGTEPNFQYKILSNNEKESLLAFSKVVEDPINPVKDFAAIMTCSHADQNCPVILGADKRLPIRYVDPKENDDTDLESSAYAERCLQIASELMYVFIESKKLLA